MWIPISVVKFEWLWLQLCGATVVLWTKLAHSFFFFFSFISWRLITLQYYSGFCHTLTWISREFTCVPHPDPPSHLPLYPIPLGLPSARVGCFERTASKHVYYLWWSRSPAHSFCIKYKPMLAPDWYPWVLVPPFPPSFSYDRQPYSIGIIKLFIWE